MDVAASVAVDCLDGIEPGSQPLVIGEESGLLARALRERASAPVEWLTREVRPGAGRPWPEAAVATSAFIRLPKAKDLLALLADAAASLLAPGAPIVLFGANEEGIRSAARGHEAVAEGLAVLAARRHCRVIAGRRQPVIASAKGSLAAWRTTVKVDVGGGPRPWVAYPGVFAKGGLDPGTALLIANLGAIGPGARVLDFAAGTGVVAAAVLERAPAVRIDMVEIDTLALAAARENVPGAMALAGRDLSAAPAAGYDLIVSNPPIHDGVAESHAVLEALIRDAPRRLVPGGALVIVVQRRVAAAALLDAAFGDVDVVAEDARFRVLRAVRPLRHRGGR